jgi:signal transduction histidine kinase
MGAVAFEAGSSGAIAATLDTGTVAYFAFFFGLLTLLLAVNISVREYVWAGFVLFGMGFLVWHAALIQSYRGTIFVEPETDIRLYAASGHCLIMIGFTLGAFIVPRDHRLYWIRNWLFGAAGLNAVLAVTAFALPPQIVVTIFNVVLIASLTTLAIPQLASRTVGSERRRTTITANLVVGLAVAAVYVLALFVFKASGETISLINLVTVAILITAGALLSLRRIFAIRDDRERILRDMLTASRKEAETSRALLEAERKYTEVRNIAKLRQDRLAEASHDIKQPIASLRTTIDAVVRDQPEETQTQLRNAFDYLEQLATAYMADAAPTSPAEETESETTSETAAASLLLGTLDRMFRAEAERKGLVFEVDYEAAQVKVQPLAVMRILGNLVSNAIVHTDKGRVSLRARIEDSSLIVSVRNTVAGLSNADMARLSEPYAKGAESPGTGLGLSIVRQLARNAGLNLTFRTDQDGGTGEFQLKLPLA